MKDLFNSNLPEVRIEKPIRLIELFAGYGSQAMALERIGAEFEHHFVCEFDKYAIRSYNAVHGTSFEPLDIRNVHGDDFRITDKDKWFYMLTYSFPCTDLSVAGKMKGMKKGSGKMTEAQLELDFPPTDFDMCWMCHLAGETSECANKLRAKGKSNNSVQMCGLPLDRDKEIQRFKGWKYLVMEYKKFNELNRKVNNGVYGK